MSCKNNVLNCNIVSRRRWQGLALVIAGLIIGCGINVLPSAPAQAACAALPSNNGTASFTITIPSTGTYRFWAHEYSPSANNNGFYMQIDSTYCQITVGDSATIPVGQFTWVDYQNGTPTNKINVNLTAGNHTITLAGLDPGVGVDKVMFAADTSCTPTGDGSNCVAASATPTPTPTPVSSTPTPSPTVVVTPTPGSTPVPGGGTPVSGTISLPSAPVGSGVTRTYYVDGKPVAGSKLDTTLLTDGNHTLEVVQKDASGKTTASQQKLVVNNHHKSWLTLALDWLKQPLHWGLIVIGLVVMTAGGWALWYFRPRLHNGGTDLRSSASSLSATPAPVVPPAGLVYPEASKDDSKT